MVNDAVPYPVSLQIARPETQSRLTNFPLGIGTLIRLVLAIPHLVILYFLGIVALIVYVIATFAILFSGRYPPGMYNFVLAYLRWNVSVTGYFTHLYDKYPPFSTDVPLDFPLSLSVQYPAESSRILNFPFFGYFVRGLLIIPHAILIALLSLALYVVVFIAQFAILFTGSFPAGMHGFCAGVTQWNIRLSAYIFGLTDRYPPFSLRE